MEGAEPAVRVLLVDDHEIVRAGLRTVLSRFGIEVAGEAGTVAGAIEAAARLHPDVVLMDVRLPDGSGIEACREIREAHPTMKILFLTAFEDEEAMLATVFSSADGYVLKEIGSEKLIEAVRKVGAGLSVFNVSVSREFMQRVRNLSSEGRQAGGRSPLSAQERRVLALVAKGKTNKEIASTMGLSPKTVKNYLSRVFEKLQVTRRSEAAARFVRDVSR